MSKTCPTALTWVLVLHVGGHAAADENPNLNATCPWLTDLVGVIEVETDYPPLAVCPRTNVVPHGELHSLVDPRLTQHGNEPMAAYLPAGSEIVLSQEVRISTALGRSYLVHELVHALQFQNGSTANAPCPGWLESEAYRVQASYLRESGDVERAFEFEILALLQGACGHAYHPDFNAE